MTKTERKILVVGQWTKVFLLRDRTLPTTIVYVFNMSLHASCQPKWRTAYIYIQCVSFFFNFKRHFEWNYHSQLNNFELKPIIAKWRRLIKLSEKVFIHKFISIVFFGCKYHKSESKNFAKDFLFQKNVWVLPSSLCLNWIETKGQETFAILFQHDWQAFRATSILWLTLSNII